MTKVWYVDWCWGDGDGGFRYRDYCGRRFTVADKVGCHTIVAGNLTRSILKRK